MISAVGAAVAATFSYLGKKTTTKVHEEVKSSNGSTTAEAVEETHKKTFDLADEVIDMRDVVEDTRDRVVELSSLFASHTADGHGPSHLRRPPRR